MPATSSTVFINTRVTTTCNTSFHCIHLHTPWPAFSTYHLISEPNVGRHNQTHIVLNMLSSFLIGTTTHYSKLFSKCKYLSKCVRLLKWRERSLHALSSDHAWKSMVDWRLPVILLLQRNASWGMLRNTWSKTVFRRHVMHSYILYILRCMKHAIQISIK